MNSSSAFGGAAIAIVLLAASAPDPASAGITRILVPIVFEHIPLQLTSVEISCSIQTLEGAWLPDVGTTSLWLVRGDVVGRAEVFLRLAPTTVLTRYSSYTCDATFRGREGTHPISVSEGIWLRRGYRVATADPSEYLYVPIAPGPYPKLRTRDTLPQTIVDELNEHGGCPCGCGGNFCQVPGGDRRAEGDRLRIDIPGIARRVGHHDVAVGGGERRGDHFRYIRSIPT